MNLPPRLVKSRWILNRRGKNGQRFNCTDQERFGTNYGLQDAIKDYIKNWAKDPQAKNMMLKNFQKNFCKPMEVDIHEHSV